MASTIDAESNLTEEADLSVGLEIRGYDTDGNGKPDVYFSYQILGSGGTEDGRYFTTVRTLPLFIGIDRDEDGQPEELYILPGDGFPCQVYKGSPREGRPDRDLPEGMPEVPGGTDGSPHPRGTDI